MQRWCCQLQNGVEVQGYLLAILESSCRAGVLSCMYHVTPKNLSVCPPGRDGVIEWQGTLISDNIGAT